MTNHRDSDIFDLKTHDGIDFLYTKQGQAVVTTAKKENVLKVCQIDSGSHLGQYEHQNV